MTTATELKTVAFLRENPLSELTARYGIVAKRHPQFPSLVFLKYHQTESPMHEPIVQECRGLILDEASDWRVVSFPFTKFFNHGEPNAHAVDWSTACVYEKLDGSLMTLYWYEGEWRVASNGTPDAGGKVNAASFTFAELFWKVFKAKGYRLPDPQRDLMWREACFVFELMTKHNRVVVNHAEDRLVLIGVRWLEDFHESRVEEWEGFCGWEVVKSFPLTTADEIVAAAEKLDPVCSEGYVVCDAKFNRVKVKCPAYVALAHLKESATPNRLLEVIRKGESDEWLVYFPEMMPAYERVRTRFAALCDLVDAEYQAIAVIESQKDFAAQAVQSRCSSALFTLRKGTAKTAREYFAGCTFNAVDRAMGAGWNEEPLEA